MTLNEKGGPPPEAASPTTSKPHLHHTLKTTLAQAFSAFFTDIRAAVLLPFCRLESAILCRLLGRLIARLAGRDDRQAHGAVDSATYLCELLGEGVAHD